MHRGFQPRALRGLRTSSSQVVSQGHSDRCVDWVGKASCYVWPLVSNINWSVLWFDGGPFVQGYGGKSYRSTDCTSCVWRLFNAGNHGETIDHIRRHKAQVFKTGNGKREKHYEGLMSDNEELLSYHFCSLDEYNAAMSFGTVVKPKHDFNVYNDRLCFIDYAKLTEKKKSTFQPMTVMLNQRKESYHQRICQSRLSKIWES